MSDVKWIKIVTNIFDNRKIKLIRKMPEGDAIVITWLQLLCLAGEVNDNGLIYVTKAVPYTDELLAQAFDTPLPIIRLAIDTFVRLEMITILDSFLCISNWEKYQNIDGLSKIREQTRNRVAKHRQNQLEAAGSNVTVTLPVTQCNATEEEIDIEIDKEKEREKKKKSSSPAFAADSDPYRAAAYLKKRILENYPSHRPITEEQLQKWAQTIERMLRIDKRDKYDIVDVIDYAQDDEFWRANILSADKLREKYDTLIAHKARDEHG